MNPGRTRRPTEMTRSERTGPPSYCLILPQSGVTFFFNAENLLVGLLYNHRADPGAHHIERSIQNMYSDVKGEEPSRGGG